MVLLYQVLFLSFRSREGWLQALRTGKRVKKPTSILVVVEEPVLFGGFNVNSLCLWLLHPSDQWLACTKVARGKQLLWTTLVHLLFVSREKRGDEASPVMWFLITYLEWWWGGGFKGEVITSNSLRRPVKITVQLLKGLPASGMQTEELACGRPDLYAEKEL